MHSFEGVAAAVGHLAVVDVASGVVPNNPMPSDAARSLDGPTKTS